MAKADILDEIAGLAYHKKIEPAEWSVSQHVLFTVYCFLVAVKILRFDISFPENLLQLPASLLILEKKFFCELVIHKNCKIFTTKRNICTIVCIPYVLDLATIEIPIHLQ